jgi:hypothetical protein
MDDVLFYAKFFGCLQINKLLEASYLSLKKWIISEIKKK